MAGSHTNDSYGSSGTYVTGHSLGPTAIATPLPSAAKGTEKSGITVRSILVTVSTTSAVPITVPVTTV